MSNYTKDNLLAIAKEDIPVGSLAIKIGGEVFPLTIGKGGSAEFYKCAEVFGPEKVSGFIVDGAGTEAVNGKYIPTDLKTEANTPIYKHETAEYYYFEMYDEQGICTSPTQYPSDGLYYNMWGEGWMIAKSGAEPPPGVMAGNFIINANVPKTWNGYKAVLTGGVYSFEDTLTDGLSYGGGFTPESGYIYPDGCLLRIGALWLGYDPALVFYAPLADNTAVAVTGQKISLSGNGGFTTFKGIPCCYGIRVLAEDENSNIPIFAQPRTVSGWACFNSTGGWVFAFGSGGNDSNTLALGCNSGKFICYSSSSALSTGVSVSTGEWYHLLVTYDGSTIKMFINGVESGTLEKKLDTTPDPGVYAGYLATQNDFDFNGYVAGIRVYNRVLSTDEILQLSKEFTPTEE